MIDFENELKKFKPVLNVNHIEDKIDHDDMQDIIDIIKEVKGSPLQKFAKDHQDKENSYGL